MHEELRCHMALIVGNDLSSSACLPQTIRSRFAIVVDGARKVVYEPVRIGRRFECRFVKLTEPAYIVRVCIALEFRREHH
jgi:hypothetical protein